MDRNVLLTAIAKAAAKAVEKTSLPIEHGESVHLDTTVKMRFVGEVSRNRESSPTMVDVPLDGYALLYVLEQEGVLPEGWRESMADIFRQAVEVKKNKGDNFEAVFKAFRESLRPVLPPKVQDRAAAILVKGNIIDFKEVTK